MRRANVAILRSLDDTKAFLPNSLIVAFVLLVLSHLVSFLREDVFSVWGVLAANVGAVLVLATISAVAFFGFVFWVHKSSADT